jgi:hypothetical protein
MIRIAVTTEAYEAIAATLPLEGRTTKYPYAPRGELPAPAERSAGESLREMADNGEQDRGVGGNRKSQSHDATVIAAPTVQRPRRHQAAVSMST